MLDFPSHRTADSPHAFVLIGDSYDNPESAALIPRSQGGGGGYFRMSHELKREYWSHQPRTKWSPEAA